MSFTCKNGWTNPPIREEDDGTKDNMFGQASYQREWRLRNADRIKLRRKREYEKDPEKLKEGRRNRYYRHRDSILARQKEKRRLSRETHNLSKQTTPTHVRILPRPNAPIAWEPATTTMIELVQDLFPNILQVFDVNNESLN